MAVCLPGHADAIKATAAPTTVFAGSAPGRGKDAQHGYHLSLDTPAGKHVRLVTLLVPLQSDQEPPTLAAGKDDTVTIAWPDGTRQTVNWSGTGDDPVRIAPAPLTSIIIDPTPRAVRPEAASPLQRRGGSMFTIMPDRSLRLLLGSLLREKPLVQILAAEGVDPGVVSDPFDLGCTSVIRRPS